MHFKYFFQGFKNSVLGEKINKIVIGTLVAIVIVGLVIAGVVISKASKINKTQGTDDPELARAMTYCELTEEDEAVEGTDNVKFSAFFLRDLDGDGYAEKIKGTCKPVGGQDSLYMSINVSTEGSLKDGKIRVEANNMYFQTAIIADESVKENCISSNTSVIGLKDLSVGTQKLIFGNVRSGDYSEDSKRMAAIQNDTSKYSGVNKIVLTGTYVTDDGEEIDIKKEVDFTVDWYNTPEAEIPEKYNDKFENVNQKYDLNRMVDIDNNTLNLSFNVVVQETGYLPRLQKACIEGTVPEINGYAPTAVMVQGDNVGYTYDESTRFFSAYRKADTSPSGVIIKQCYDREYDKKRFTVFTVTAVYPMDVYNSMGVNTVAIDVPVRGWFEAFNNPNEEFDNPVKSNIAENVITTTYEKGSGDVIGFDIKVGRYVGGEYNSWVVSKNNANKYYAGGQDLEDTYEVMWFVTRGTDGKVSSVRLSEQDDNYTDKFLRSDGTYVDMSGIVQNKGIYFSGAQGMFDSETGFIDVINDETGELIHRFDKSDWSLYNKNNPYLYSSKVSHIRIETSETKNSSSLFIYNIKEINHEKLKAEHSQEEFDKFIYIASYVKASLKYDGSEVDYIVRKNDTDRANYDGERSVAEIKSISTETFSTQETKKNVQMVIAAEQLSYNTSKWKNGEFVVKFPKEVLDVKINDIQCLEKDVTIAGYSLEENDDGVYIRILTENETPTTFNMYLDIDISPDPSILNASRDIELYYLNPECEMYPKMVQDVFDVDDDGDVEEYVGKTTKSIQLVGPASMATFEKASEYNDNGDMLETAIAPKIAIIDKSDEEKTAKVTVEILNNYSGSIEEIKVVGKIPFEGNTFQLKDTDLGSVYSTTMVSKIVVPENLKDIVKVYYSENEKVNEDLTDESNNWIEESKVTDLSKVKSFLIDLSGYSMQKGESADFTYGIKLPGGLDYNDVSYATHAVYFSLKTEEGKLRDKTETNKLGFMVAKKFNLRIQKVKEDTEIGLRDARYQLIDEVDNSSSITKTRADGSVSFNNLYVNRKYILKEIKAPEGYTKAESVEFETVVADDGKIELNVLSGSVKSVVDVENETLPTKEFVLEDSPLFNLKIKKVSKGTDDGIADVEYEVQKVGDSIVSKYKTKDDGSINVTNLETDAVYELREVKATGYYVQSEPVRFRVFRQDGEYKVEVQNGEVRDSQVVSNNGTKDIPEVTFVIENEKIPTYSLRINKYSVRSHALLPNASFKVSGPGIDGEATYTTDENGTFIIDNLYLYQEGKELDCVYTIKESVPPAGYCLNEEEFYFRCDLKSDGSIDFIRFAGAVGQSLDENGIEVQAGDRWYEIDQDNRIVTAKVYDEPIFRLMKVDGSTKETLPNVKFAIFGVDEKGENYQAVDVTGNVVGVPETIDGVTYQVITTDENGEISLDLPYGIYKVIEVEALEGYQFSDDLEDRTYYFGVDKSQNEVKKWITDTDMKLGSLYMIYSVVASQDGGYFEIGRMSGYVRISGDETVDGNDIEVQAYDIEISPLIIKRNFENKVEYVKVIKTVDMAEYTLAEKTSDGGFIVTGNFYDTFIIDAEDSADGTKKEFTGPAFVIAKYNSDCKVEYIRKIDNGNYGGHGMSSYNSKFMGMTVQENGDYILEGYIHDKITFSAEDTESGSEIVLNQENKRQCLIVKFNKDGKVKWASCFGGDSTSAFVNDGFLRVKTDESNNVYVTGAFTSSNLTIPAEQTASGEEIILTKDANSGTYAYNYMMVKYNEDGKVVNAISYDVTIDGIIAYSDKVISYMQVDSKTFTIPASKTVDGKEIVIDEPDGTAEVCVIYDANLKVQSAEVLFGLEDMEYYSGIKTEDNGFVIEGSSFDDLIISGENTANGDEIKLTSDGESAFIWIVKYNSDMKVEWASKCPAGYDYIEELSNNELLLYITDGEIQRVSGTGEILSGVIPEQGKLALTDNIYTSDGGRVGIGRLNGNLKIHADYTVDNKEIILSKESDEIYVYALVLIKYNYENKVEWVTKIELNSTGVSGISQNCLIETDDGYYYSLKTGKDYIVNASETVDGKEIKVSGPSVDLIHFNKSGKIISVSVMNAEAGGDITKVGIAKGKDGIGVGIELDKGSITIPAEGTVSGEEIKVATDGSKDQFIVSFDQNDKAKWAHVVTAKANNWYGGITATEDGGYITAGTFWWPITFSADETASGEVLNLTSNGAYDYVFVKYNKDGLIEWAINEGGTERDTSSQIIKTSDNGFIAIGFINSKNYTIPGERTASGEPIEVGSAQGYDAFIIKYDENHLVEWATVLGGTSTDQFVKVKETEDGYLVSGIFVGDVTIPAEKTVNGNEITFHTIMTQNPLIKFNKQGLVEWVRIEELDLNDYKDGKILLGGSGPTVQEIYEKTIAPDVAASEVITIENNKKKYSILTEVEVGDSGEKGGSISGEDEKPYEVVTHGEDSTKEIKIVPEADYKVLKITVNDKQIDFTPGEDGSVVLDKFENVTSDLKVVVKFSKTVANITVHHYKDGSTEKLADDEVLRGEVGSDYTTSPKEIDGYVLVMDKIPYNASGKYSEADDEVYYYYKGKPAKLIVHYYEEGTETELAPTVESEVDRGSEYVTEEPDGLDDRYELVEVPANAKGSVNDDEIVVNYYFRVKVLDIVTEVEVHKEMNEFGELVDVAGGTIVGDEKVTYGGDSTKDVIAKPDEGYHVVRITVNGEEIEFTEVDGQVELAKFVDVTEDKVIKVEFGKSSSRVVVHFYEEGTTNSLSDNVIIQGEEGDEYKTEPATDVSSDYELAGVPENATGVMNGSTIDVIYYYKRRAKVVARYFDKDSGEEIEASVTVDGFKDDEYVTEAKDVKFYKLVETPENAKGTMKVTVTKDENGDDVVEDTTYVDYYYRKLVFNLKIDKTVASVSVNGVESVINGDLAKVEMYRKDMATAKVQVKYLIRVTNDGELSGKSRVLEKLPAGMTMSAEKNDGWVVEGSTATRETKVLAPGESEEFEVVLDWQNGDGNVGTKKNVASLVETENEAGFDEKDSADNEDKAIVLVEIGTGGNSYVMYAGGVLLVLIAMACGVYIVKRQE